LQVCGVAFFGVVFYGFLWKLLMGTVEFLPALFSYFNVKSQVSMVSFK
jgi:hypothetical protein